MDEIVDLNDYTMDGTISCPYCEKGKAYLYNAKGMASQPCANCGRIVLWDYDNKKSFKAKAKKYVS